MADTYIINASNQTVTGTAAGEIFEFDSTLTNSTFTNVVINAVGGKDTLSDSLCGGNGADTFLIGKNDGSDAVFKAGNDDSINLYDVTLDDIASAGIDANTIALNLKSGNVISVANGEDLSPTFMLANGQSYRYNRTSNSWQNV